ncbi:MAG: YciI family protein [Rhodospirillaceae bacterium]
MPDAAPFIAQHLKAHEDFFKAHEDRFIFRGPLRSPDGTENVGSALMIELPDRAAAEHFWANEPFSANGGYQDDFRIYRWVFGD